MKRCFFLENDFTRQQYQNVRIGAKRRNCNIYPPYNDIIKAKKLCYPDDLYISESTCKVSIQNLLNHTASRIIQSLNFKKIELNTTHFEMLCKWGCDGSSGHAQYKQKFDSSYSTTITDSDLFLFSLVPLQLRLVDEQNIVVWQNPRPSSTRFCRPIKFCFKKETIDSTLEEVKDVESEISRLIPTTIINEGKELRIKHKLIFSMIDGKVSTIVNNSVQKWKK
jgi:hypothetical protein